MRRLSWGFVPALALAAPSVHAQAKDAAALFDHGLAEMQAHRYETGCPALEESYRSDPHPGVLITLAECEYGWGKLVQAQRQFATYLETVTKMPKAEARMQADRVKLATQRVAELEHDIPVLTLVTKDGVPAGSTLSLDGDAPTPPGTVRRVDPGAHTARLVAPGGASETIPVSIAKGEARSIAVGLTTPAAPPPAVAVPAQPPSEPAPASDPRRPWLFASIGVGAAGILAGSVLGAVALADKSTISAHCPTPGTCDSASAVSTANGAVSIGWASTAAFGVGLAGAAAAVTLWVMKPPRTGVAIVPVLTPPSAHAYGSVGARVEF